MPISQPSSAPRHISYPIRSLFTITEAEERSQCSSRSSAQYTDCESDEDLDHDDSTVFESDSEDHAFSIRDSLTPMIHDASEPTSADNMLAERLNYLSFIKLEGFIAQKRRFGDEVKLVHSLPRRAPSKQSTTTPDKSLPPPPPISAPQDLHYWKTIAESSQRRCEQLQKAFDTQQSSTQRLVTVYENTVLRLKEKLLDASSSFQAMLRERDELRKQLRSAGMSGGHVEVDKRVSFDTTIETPLHCLDGTILPGNDALATNHHSLPKPNAHQTRHLQNVQPSTEHVPASQAEELKAKLDDALSCKKSLQEELNHSRRLFINSQRRIKYLMEATYHHLEADRDVPPPPPPPTHTNISPSPAVIQSVRGLNDYIGQSSLRIASSLEKNPVDAFVGQERARRVLGDRLTGMLERRKSRLLKEDNALLLRVVIDIFLVHWGSSIINGCYPKPKKLYDHIQQSSGSIAASGSSSSIDSKLAFSEDGIFALISSIRSDHSPVDLNTWLHDIYSDLSLIMSTLGLKVKAQQAQAVVSVLQTIIDKSYELRCALSQREHCGYLETILITPDTEFSSSCMSDIYRNSKTDITNGISLTPTVLGTCSIGLQQCPPIPYGPTTGTAAKFCAGKVILKPGVALRNTLK